MLKKMMIGATIVAGLSTLLGMAIFHTLIMESQSEINTLREGVDAAKEENRNLKNNLAEATAPENIVEEAERLGLITPTTIEYIPFSNSNSRNSDPEG